MKNLLLFAVFLCASSISFGQDISLFTVEIDSMENLLHAVPKEDTIKVKRLNDLAQMCFYDLQYKRGAIAAKQALNLASKLNYPIGEGMYLRTLSCTSMRPYYATKARLFYKQLNISEPVSTVKDKDGSKSYYEKGVLRLQEDVKGFEMEKDTEMAGNAYVALSFISDYLEKPDHGIAYFDKAILAFKNLNLNVAVAYVLMRKMRALQNWGKTAQIPPIEVEANGIVASLDNGPFSAFLNLKMAEFYDVAGKTAIAVEKALRANNDLEITEDKVLQIEAFQQLGVYFGYLSMSSKAVEYYKKGIQLREKLNYYDDGIITTFFNLGYEYVALKKFSEAEVCFSRAKALADSGGNNGPPVTFAPIRYLDGSGQILMGKNKFREALSKFYEANALNKKLIGLTHYYVDFYIATCYQKTGDLQKSSRYGEQSYAQAVSYSDQGILLKICLLLSDVYEQLGDTKKSYVYLKKYRAIIQEKEEQDIGNRAASFEIQSLIDKNQRIKEGLEKEKLQQEKENQNQRWWLISIASALISTFVVLYILFRNNKQKQKANVLLQRQKEEINTQRHNVEKAFAELKSTQAQLIQSEKMASLGELTAGIAHEIQNPLNFVNNFSETNTELLSELKEEISKGNIQEVAAIATDVIENEQKITHHGRRAEAIVKSMLEHSRASKGEKQLTDINTLCEEYLRLAYHGFRAKDKLFNAMIKTDFDNSIGKISIAPQEIGRVLLNLFNNAFYATHEQLKKLGEGYKPTVSISTKKLADKIKISVQDNGMGISKSVQDKIFQPFFTTKPTGEGTGLGLSLSYDIIKSHGGELKVESKEGDSSTFVIILPLS